MPRLLIVVILAAQTLAAMALPALAAPCPSPDNLTRVSGGDECLVIKTVAKAGGNASRVLYVLLHGGHSDGSPAVSFYPFADTLMEQAPPGSVAVAMIRPGHRDAEGNESGGNGGIDDWHDHNIDLITDAIARLKHFHHADRLVLVGQSAGAAVSGVIIGRRPGLADAAMLIGCPCQMGPWRFGKPNKAMVWVSLSPDDYLDGVPLSTMVTLMVGDDDSETRPALSQGYAAGLRARGVPVSLTILEGHGHVSPIRSQRVINATLRLGRGTQ
jgi:poly(3-hydroxybutyrate) depolymerase